MRYPQPDTEQEFEELCLRLYRKSWKNEALVLYAKRGEKQDGIDIIDLLGRQPFQVVQCKFHEPTKTLTPAEIEAEVRKAEQSSHQIDTYFIATTAKRSKHAQDKIIALNQRPSDEKQFDVVLHYWDELCKTADEQGPAEAIFIVYGQEPQSLFGLASPAILVKSDQESSNELTREGQQYYSEIDELLASRKIEVAEHEINKLPSGEEFQQLSSMQQYQILRLRGKLELEKGNVAEASQWFLLAFEENPDCVQAKQNQVLAYWLSHNNKKAYDLASMYLNQGIDSDVMVTHFVRSLESYDELQSTVEKYDELISEDEILSTSVAHRYFEFKKYEQAQSFAQQALILSPESPHVHFELGMIFHEWGLHGHWSYRTNRLAQALEHYNSTIAFAELQSYQVLLPDTYMNRGSLRCLLHDDEADKDLLLAAQISSTPEWYAERAIPLLLSRNKAEKAERLLKHLDLQKNAGQFLKLCVESEVGDEQTKLENTKSISRLADKDWDRAIECRFHGVQWALELNNIDLARSFITEEVTKEFPFHAYVLNAWVEGKSHNFDQAQQYANQAMEVRADNWDEINPHDLRMLSHIFLELGDDHQALILLEQIIVPGYLDQNMKDLVQCAQRLERHDLLLRVCQEMRECGTADEKIQSLEVDLLSAYAPNQAIKLIEEYLANEAGNSKYFRAFKNYLAIRLSQPELLELDFERLPSPEELGVDRSRLIVIPYIAMSLFDEALVFLHRQLRHFFDDFHAHRNYISLVVTHEGRLNLLPPLEVVQQDCAVLLGKDGEEPYWVIFDDNSPKASHSEFYSQSPLFRSLVGLTTDDQVQLPGTMIGDEFVTIREIQSKYVRAFQDCLDHFRQRFPDEHFLQKVDVGDPNNPDLTGLLDTLSERSKHIELCYEKYVNNPCSIYFLAKMIGRNEFETTQSLATDPKYMVKCYQTNPAELERRAEQGVSSKIVLDLSAVISITLAGGWEHLDPNKQYVVSQMTKELIDSWVREDDENLGSSDDSITQEAKQHRYSILRLDANCASSGLIRFMQQQLSKNCEFRSSMRLAGLEPKRRKEIAEMIGLHHLESICCAMDEECSFWCDDYPISIVAKGEFDVEPIWNQAIFLAFHKTGVIDSENYHQFIANLLAMNYVTIVWQATTLVGAGKVANWDSKAWPLKQALFVAGQAKMPTQVHAQLLESFLKELRQSSCPVLLQSKIIQACLNALDSLIVVQQVRRNLPGVFRIDFGSENFVRRELDNWLRLRS